MGRAWRGGAREGCRKTVQWLRDRETRVGGPGSPGGVVPNGHRARDRDGGYQTRRTGRATGEGGDGPVGVRGRASWCRGVPAFWSPLRGHGPATGAFPGGLGGGSLVTGGPSFGPRIPQEPGDAPLSTPARPVDPAHRPAPTQRGGTHGLHRNSGPCEAPVRSTHSPPPQV